MPRSATTTVFAGVDGRADVRLPDWYAAQHSAETTDVASCAEAIRDLPQATETRVAYHNPYDDSWVETSRFDALVEPSRLSMNAQTDPVEPDGGMTSPLIPTDDR